MNLVLANAEDIRILKNIFFSGHLLRGENDIYKVVEVVPSGLVAAKCNVSKIKDGIVTEVGLPLKTIFLLYEDDKEDEYMFASQIIRDHSEDAIEYRKVIRKILGFEKGDSQLRKIFGNRKRKLPLNKANVPADFFLTNIEVERQQFQMLGVFSNHAMEQLEQKEITIDMFRIPNMIKIELLQQVMSLHSKENDHRTKKLYRDYLIRIWDNYMKTSCDLDGGIKQESVGDALVAWLKQEKIPDIKIQRFERVKLFLEFTSGSASSSSTKKSSQAKRQHTETIEQLQHLNNKRRKTIAELKFRLKTLQSGKKLKSCPTCKKAGGICNKRGQPGHLPLLEFDEEEVL